MENLFPVMGAFGFCLVVGWMVTSLASGWRQERIAKFKLKAQSQLLEKFASADEIIGFLESDAGRELVRGSSFGPASTRRQILSALQSGLILIFAGIAFVIASRSAAFDDHDGSLLLIGMLGVGVGLAFVLSGGITHWLSKRWGVIDDRSS